MEKVRNFSIEPYVDNGGILGMELKVNRTASLTLMSTVGFRQDINLYRIDSDGKYSAQGSNEIALARMSTNSSAKVGQFDNSELIKKKSGWEIAVYDQELHRDVDGWMQKKYKKGANSASTLYKEKFVELLNGETQKNLSVASSKEKNEKFKEHVLECLGNDLGLGVSLGITSLGYWGIHEKLIPAFSAYSSDERTVGGQIDIAIMCVSWIALSVGIHMSTATAVEIANKRKDKSLWETVLPNPQLRNRMQSRNAIKKLGKELINFES